MAVLHLSLREKSEIIIDCIQRMVLLPREAIQIILLGMLCRGYVLITGLYPSKKTLLLQSLAGVTGGIFRHIQFTPNSMPTDIIGCEVDNYDPNKPDFNSGPIFGNICLADAINRAKPQTRNVLFETIGKGQMIWNRTSYHLPDTFFLIGTQRESGPDAASPLLPAELDMFMLSLVLSSTGEKDTAKEEFSKDQTERDGETVITIEEIQALQYEIDQVEVSQPLMEYAANIAAETMEHPDILMGLSSRGMAALLQAARGRAAMCDRSCITSDDIQSVAQPVLQHRLVIQSSRDDATHHIVKEILDSITVPL